ncbi:MAG: thioredoxin domain-containing protein, partial [Actinobacteria bacterium]|nr:thioredoxin domain-containing protein [Actinomycetota bacterium]
QVLVALSEAYRARRDDLERQATRLVEAIQEASARSPSSDPLTTSLLTGAVRGLERQFDEVYGGFGPAPKFPPASTLEFLLRVAHDGRAPEALPMATLTLDRMAAGGMYDQLGGGFHRYSVDAIWLVPHFEKMLYDNALLASAYLHAWLVTDEERYRRVVEETLDYLVREMLLPEGGFASAQDADTEGEEGLTYVWTPAEIRAVVGDEAAERICRRYGVTEEGNFEGKSILFLADADADDDPRARAALLEARSHRPQPLRDDKALAAWNGLALAAFAEAGARLGRADYLDVARALAQFLLGTLSSDQGRLLRTYRDGVAKIDGYLEDYANVANGLLELSFATGELRWLEEARRLADLALELFGDPERGGFFFDSAEGATLVARRKEFDDHPTPSGNSMIAYVLLRLARIYGDAALEREAVGVFRLAQPFLERAPAAVGHMLCALDLHFAPPREIAVVGPPEDAATEELRRTALAPWEPNTVFAFSSGAGDPAAERVPLLAGKDVVDGRPAAYVCESFACRAPVTSADGLAAALAR